MTYHYELPPAAKAFDDYLGTDIPNVIGDYVICHDFTQHGAEWDRYPAIRALSSVINWKSNVGGSDSVHNFRCSLSDDILRGDYVYDSASGTIGMITYYIDKMIDCKRTQVSTCNGWVEIYRDIPEQVDPETGMLTAESSMRTIVRKTPCFYASMYGRYLYEIQNNAPGIMPDQKIELRLQWNMETREICSGDRFLLRGIEHRVMFVTYDYLDMDELHGFIVLTCERVE